MLAWMIKKFRGRDAPPPPGLPSAEAALKTYNDLLKKYSNSVIDEKQLPLPRAEMKALLLEGVKAAQNPNDKRAAGLAYVSLCYFQPGVGDAPLDDTVPDDIKEMNAKFTPEYIAFQKKVNAEMSVLHNELQGI